MRKFSTAAAIATILTLVQSALAADLPTKAPGAPIAPMGAYSWTGLYIGGTAGGVFGDWSYTNPGAGFESAKNHVSGAIAGGTLGYNWQTGTFVLGVEGDYSWSDAKATDLSGCSAPGCRMEFPWFATARVRAGLTFDRWLVYVTGGGVWSRGEQTFLPDGHDDGRKNISGWTGGGGIEVALWHNWSAKVEVLHMDFGNQTIFNPAIATNIVHHLSNENLARFGMNYRLW